MSASLAGSAAADGRRAGTALVYAGAFVQCMAQVSFAASATVFRERLSFTDAQYGAIFLPQITLATLGAIGGGALARRIGLRSLLVAGSLALAAAECALLLSVFVAPGGALLTVMAGTGLMGLGAGLSAAPMNAYPQLLFPFRRDSALVGVHAVNGLGLTAGPLLAGTLLARDAWTWFPALLAAANLALALAARRTNLPPDPHAAPRPTPAAGHHDGSDSEPVPVRDPAFWAFVAMAFTYALAEGAFASWAVIFLREDRGLSAPLAAFGLALFWTGLTVGRMLVASVVLRFSAEPFWLALPLMMAILLCSLPLAASEPAALAFFAVAGLACSGFFPLTIGMASRRFPRHVAWVSSMVYAGLALGVGAGPFVIGLLRPHASLTRLFAFCAIEPVVAAALAAFVLAGSAKWRYTKGHLAGG